MTLLVATTTRVLAIDPDRGTVTEAQDLAGLKPSCLAADPLTPGRAWCGTGGGGLWRSDDAGRSWRKTGLDGETLTAVAASPAERGRVWAGTEPSALWTSADGGESWRRAEGLGDLSSSAEWSFPPKQETHHVRWIACHPTDAGRLWLAIEAGALVSTPDGSGTWRDRVPGGSSTAGAAAPGNV